MQSTRGVACSGAVLSSLLGVVACAEQDQVGLLLGSCAKGYTEELDDSDAGQQRHTLHFGVESVVMLGGVGELYDANCRPRLTEVRALLARLDRDITHVIGWCKVRAHAPVCVSIKERAVHNALEAVWRHAPLLFAVFGSALSTDHIYSYDHNFFTHVDGKMKLVPLHVTNLSSGGAAEYEAFVPSTHVLHSVASSAHPLQAVQRPGPLAISPAVTQMEGMVNTTLEQIKGMVEEAADLGGKLCVARREQAELMARLRG